MSIIDNANHNVVPYISGTTKPFTGQRLVAITYKTVTDKNSSLYNIKRDSKAVSIPHIDSTDISNNIAVLMPHIKGMLESVQKNIIRDLLDASNNVLSIANDDISISACIEYLESSDESGRLTKDSVSSWFDSNISEVLTVAIAEKLGVSDVPTDAESKKVLDIIAAFRGNIASLAGGKTLYPPKTAVQIKKALEYAPIGDVIAGKFIARLDKMIAIPADALIDCL